MIQRQKILEYFLIFLILSFGLFLRYINVQVTEVDAIRADAMDYYAYAINLKEHGIYSRANPNNTIANNIAPVPDKFRPPAYSLFIYPYVEYPPTNSMLKSISNANVVVSFLTLLTIFLIGNLTLPFWLTAVVTALTAISPHLISLDTYMLTETLFTFALAVHLLFICLYHKSGNPLWAVPAGISLGFSLLVKPTMLYSLFFLIPAFILLAKTKHHNLKPVVIFLISFLVAIAPWHIRNLTLESTQNQEGKSLTKISIHNGSYPDLMVNGNPKTQGSPHRADPEYNNYQTYGEIFGNIIHRIKEKPLEYINWYLWGKMKMFFSWDMKAGGWGDIYVYPVLSSAYFNSHLFQNTRSLMYFSHGFVSLTAFICIFIIWLPSITSCLNRHTLSIARYISAIFLYFMVVHQIGTPLPRYSVPLRPELYFMFGIFIWIVFIKLTEKWRGVHHEKQV